MTLMYPNDFDIYGFTPKEETFDVGDYVVDRRTGMLGRVRMRYGELVVAVGGSEYEVVKGDKNESCIQV